MSAPAARLVPLEDGEGWRDALRGVPHAFAHTRESCHAMQLTTGWPTSLAVLEAGGARVVCPVAERPWGEHVDAVTPYGFGGFAGRAADASFLAGWRALAGRRGWVCAYVGLNPLFAPPALRGDPDYAEHNDVYVLELDRDADALHAALSENRRRQLRAAAADPGGLVEDRGRLAAFFLEQVAGFLARKGAGGAYAFTPETLAALVEHENTLLVGGGAGGRVEAVCVFAHTPHCAEYLFGVSLPEGRARSAALLWEGAMRLRALGIPRLNLGGGIRRGDGVAEFKERFGAARLPLGSLRQVFRPDVYAALCREAGADPADRAGYFPAYRAARPVAAR
jgi:hypothetical protein